MFKKIYVEITNVCNLSCSFCSPVKRKNEFITVENFKHVINEIKTFCKHIYLHVKGEPLLHPHLHELLIICNENNIKIDITTNGTLIWENKDILINDSIRQINISLHSFEGDNGHEYLKQVCDFAKEITHKTKTVVVFREWIMSDDYIKNYLKQEFNLNNIDVKRSTALANNIYLSQAEQFDWPSLDMPHISNRGFCYGMRRQVAILVDGTVVPCCLDSDGVINLGNIYKTSFKDIINSQRAVNIADSFSKRHAVEELCRKCTYKERFTHGQKIN